MNYRLLLNGSEHCATSKQATLTLIVCQQQERLANLMAQFPNLLKLVQFFASLNSRILFSSTNIDMFISISVTKG